MVLVFIALCGATAASAGLIWRLAKIAKHEGLASLFTVRAEETLLHACLLFGWALFVREGSGVLLYSNPNELTAGFGSLFGGLFAMCLSRTKTRPASVPTGGKHG